MENRPLAEVKADLFKAPARSPVAPSRCSPRASTRSASSSRWSASSPSHLSQQLGVLRRAGLVTAHREGASVRYRLADPLVAELLAVAKRLLKTLSGTCDLLDDPPPSSPMTRLLALPRRHDYDGLRRHWRATSRRRDRRRRGPPLALAFGITTGLGAAAGPTTAIVAGPSPRSSVAPTSRCRAPPAP